MLYWIELADVKSLNSGKSLKFLIPEEFLFNKGTTWRQLIKIAPGQLGFVLRAFL